MKTEYNEEYNEGYKVEHLESQDSQEEGRAEDELPLEPEPQPERGDFWYIINGEIYYYDYEQDNGLKAIPDQQMRQILAARDETPSDHTFKLYDNGAYEYIPPTPQEEKEKYIEVETAWALNEWELIKNQLMLEMVLEMQPIQPMHEGDNLKDYGKSVVNYANYIKSLNPDDNKTSYKVDRPTIGGADLKSILKGWSL